MRKYVVSFFAAFLMLLACSGCVRVETEQSSVLHEDAVVIETVYTPSRHDTNLGMTAIKAGAIGMDFSGDVGIRIGGGLQISSSEVPEKFAVVFKCKHGKFIVDHKEVYEKLKGKEDKIVDVSYTEVYQTTYDKKDGKEYVIDRILIKYHFLDATLK